MTEKLHLSKSFKVENLKIQLAYDKKYIPNLDLTDFGKQMSDHMLVVDYCDDDGWSAPLIKPFDNLNLHPATTGLHYGTQVFEGMKAFRAKNGQVHLFRPMDHIERFIVSATRMCLPIFDKHEFLKCLIELIKVDQEWCPHNTGQSLYIRPFMFSTGSSVGIKPPSNAKLVIITCPVGDYHKTSSNNGISLYADPFWVRSWPGGVGDIKAGGNYGPTLMLQKKAMQLYNCDQILWLFNDEITECGAMNIFVYLTNDKGQRELVTPPLNGLILPGITRKSILQITKQWNEIIVSERVITLTEIIEAHNQSRLYEIFGSGTACVVTPVKRIIHKNFIIQPQNDTFSLSNRIHKELMDIQYGVTPSEWTDIKIPKS